MVWRNLGIAYFNVLGDAELGRVCVRQGHLRQTPRTRGCFMNVTSFGNVLVNRPSAV